MAHEDLPEMPFLRNVGLVLTCNCQVECAPCIIDAGPRHTEVIAVSDAYSWIRRIAAYRGGYVRVLSLTGGEPFYDIDLLRRISDFGASRGLLVSAVTNAYWAVTKASAIKTLKDLPAVRMLAISADVRHRKAIPLERIRNAIQAARGCDLPFNVNVRTEDENDRDRRELVRQIEEVAGHGSVDRALTFPAGRALNRRATPRYGVSEDPPASACPAGSLPIVFPDGRVVACIGPVRDVRFPHPLFLGNLTERPLSEIFDDAEMNSILHAIRVWGPRKLVASLQEAGEAARLPKQHVKSSVCTTCCALMASPDLTVSIAALAADVAFSREVAFARLHDLGERRMLELLDVERVIAADAAGISFRRAGRCSGNAAS